MQEVYNPININNETGPEKQNAVLPYVRLENVSFRYPRSNVDVVCGASIELFQTQTTAIEGPNGSGKTTLGKLITGILKPASGKVFIRGRETGQLSLGEIGCLIGYLFQNPDYQIFAPTVREEIAFPLEFKGVDEQEIKDLVDTALETFQLGSLQKSHTFTLSRGEKQRLAIAAMLVTKQRFLVLDEPTTGLDIERKQVLSGVLSALKQQGIGMVIISHDHDFIRQHADRIIRISGGVITSEVS